MPRPPRRPETVRSVLHRLHRFIEGHAAPAVSKVIRMLNWEERSKTMESDPGCQPSASLEFPIQVRAGASSMKLAEALALRSDTTRKVAHLRERIVDNARHQEGEVPAEDAAVLLEELTSTLSELERLMRAINRTNAQAILGNGTVTDALAHRDVLRLRHSAVNAAADAASGREERGYGRQLRSELVYVAAVPVTELRAIADDLAREIREVDTQIQRTNWEVDLIE